MTTDRPYRRALTKDETLEELAKNRGTQFDPQVCDAMMDIINQQPLKA